MIVWYRQLGVNTNRQRFPKMAQIAGKLAAQIRETIDADGRTIYALAKDSGISRQQLGLFVRGESDMTLTIAAKLCETLGLDLVKRRQATGKQTGRDDARQASDLDAARVKRRA